MEDLMKKSPYIQELSDPQFIMRSVPTTILVSRMDESFTILEANDEYYRLIGYTKEEVWEKFRNCGFDTLHPDDRMAALESITYQTQAHGEKIFTVKCRLVHKTEGYRMAHFRGCREMLHGEPVMYFLITDITEHMHVVRQLEEEQEFNKMISTFTENSFFEYNLVTDSMRYSREFATRIGTPNIMKHCRKTMVELGIISQETMERLVGHFHQAQPGREMMEDEFELTTLDGEKMWYQCCYRCIYDEERDVVRIVGRMTDMTKHQSRLSELSNKASRDSLTGLFNKEVTERMIRDYLKIGEEKLQHAFLIVDLDNFKQINDNLGHLYGDGVLKDVANVLREHFRQDDVIGRIGGDEFVVFMKHCKSTETVFFKAKELSRILSKTYIHEDTSIAASASVGVSLYPLDGDTFENLYNCADKALYTVKKSGKNGVAFYDWA